MSVDDENTTGAQLSASLVRMCVVEQRVRYWIAQGGSVLPGNISMFSPRKSNTE